MSFIYTFYFSLLKLKKKVIFKLNIYKHILSVCYVKFDMDMCLTRRHGIQMVCLYFIGYYLYNIFLI